MTWTKIVAPPAITQPWVPFTPILAQGDSTDIAATTTECRFLYAPNLVIAKYRVDALDVGTAGSDVTLELPTPSADNGYLCGYVYYVDANGPDYFCGAWMESTSLIKLATDVGKFGTSPAVTVGIGDIITMTITYEPAP
jgi:hypothetical protein